MTLQGGRSLSFLAAVNIAILRFRWWQYIQNEKKKIGVIGNSSLPIIIVIVDLFFVIASSLYTSNGYNTIGLK